MRKGLEEWCVGQVILIGNYILNIVLVCCELNLSEKLISSCLVSYIVFLFTRNLVRIFIQSKKIRNYFLRRLKRQRI